MGSGGLLPLPRDPKISIFASENSGPAMRATLCLSLLLLGLSGAQAVPPQDASPSADKTDPQAWLEEVHGAKPLAWVAAQNSKALGILKADPRYQKYYDSVLSVLDAPDR